MANNLESQIDQIVAHAAAQIAQAVRDNIAAEVKRITGGHAAAVAPPIKRKPGRPPKAAAGNVPAPAPPAARPKKVKRGRGVATFSPHDLDTVLGLITAKPGRPPAVYRAASKLADKIFVNVIKKLKNSGRVKAKGSGAGTTYTAG